jgi:hypothetical protein
MTTYYVNPGVADNTGAGTSPATAKKVIPTALQPGDRVRLLRGSVYTGNEWTANPGTATAHIVFEAYANADGSDDAAQARPIVNRTTVTATYGSANKDYVDIFNLDIRGDVAVANDAAMLYLGEGATVRGVRVDTNVGCIAAYNRSNLLVLDCDLAGVSHDNTKNNNLLVISADSKSIDNVRVAGTVFRHKGGGGTGSHCMRLETTSPSYALTNLLVEDNYGPPANGAEKQANPTAMGIRVGRCPGAIIQRNKFRGAFAGIFANGGGGIVTGIQILDNDVQYAYMFGIHLPGGTRNCKIGRNLVSYAGSNRADASYYGRGIEISSSGGQGQNGGHEVFKNVADNCYNWGSPSDNGSEGVGIGLDDGTDTCYVWGNHIANNEGNGLQQYGGTGTMTGGHRIVGNYFENNCTKAVWNRRTGGALQTPFVAACAFAGHLGNVSMVANNIFKNEKCGISETANSGNILDKANNIFIDVAHPISMPPTFTRASNNVFYAPTVSMVKYSNSDVDGNSVPVFSPIPYTGVSDFTFDPMLDADNKLRDGSPAVGAGKYLGAYSDYAGQLVKNPPSIGMYESFTELGWIGGGMTAIDSEYGDAASILVPIDITNSPFNAPKLISATAGGNPLLEDAAPLWNVGNTYTTGQRVYMASTHRVYESVKDGNTGKVPSVLANQFNAAGVATWWTDVGPTNLYAMFDGLISTPTTAASPLEVVLSPGQFNGFALFGIDADSYKVQVLDGPGGEVVYNEPLTPLEGSQPTDYYDYFFSRFKPLTQVVRTGIEPYGTAQIKLTLYNNAGPVKLGMFALGDMRPTGIPQRDASVEPQDFSVIKQDAFGNTTTKKRANATGMTINTKMDKEDASAVLTSLKDVLGVPVVVIGSEAAQYEWMTVFGLVSARMSPAEYPFVTLNMTVRGLI